MQEKGSQDAWRAGCAHAGVLLVLSLVALRSVDEANLQDRLKRITRVSVSVAILLPAALFLPVLTPDPTKPNGFIYLAYVGAAVLAVGLVVLGVGLLKENPTGTAL